MSCLSIWYEFCNVLGPSSFQQHASMDKLRDESILPALPHPSNASHTLLFLWNSEGKTQNKPINEEVYLEHVKCERTISGVSITFVPQTFRRTPKLKPSRPALPSARRQKWRSNVGEWNSCGGKLGFTFCRYDTCVLERKSRKDGSRL